jgi:chromosome segregation ATPase
MGYRHWTQGSVMNALRQDRPENTVEERVTRLETHVEHILGYLADLKAGLARLEAKVDKLASDWDAKLERLEAKWDATLERLETKWEARFERLETRWDARFERLEAKSDEKFAKIDDRFDKMDARLTRIIWWALGLYIALAATLLGVMARGFHWL